MQKIKIFKKRDIFAIILVSPIVFYYFFAEAPIIMLPWSTKIPDQIRAYLIDKKENVLVLPIYLRDSGVMFGRNRYYYFDNPLSCDPSNIVNAIEKLPSKVSLGIKLKNSKIRWVDSLVGNKFIDKGIGWINSLIGVYFISKDGETIFVNRPLFVFRTRNEWDTVAKYWLSQNMKDSIYRFFSKKQYPGEVNRFFRTLNRHSKYDFKSKLSNSENKLVLSFIENINITDVRIVKDRWESIRPPYIINRVKYFSIIIESDPKSAEVYIDEVKEGITPLRLELEKGSYLIQIKKMGHETVTNEIILPEDSGTKVFVMKKSQ